MYFRKTLSVVLAFLSIFGLPQRLSTTYLTISTFLEHQNVRDAILFLAVLLFFAETIINFIPKGKVVLGYLQIWLYRLQPLNEFIKELVNENLEGTGKACDTDDALTEKILNVVPIKKALRAGYCEASFFDKTTGIFAPLTPSKIIAFPDYLAPHAFKSLYANRKKLQSGLGQMKKEYKLATGSDFDILS